MIFCRALVPCARAVHALAEILSSGRGGELKMMDHSKQPERCFTVNLELENHAAQRLQREQNRQTGCPGTHPG